MTIHETLKKALPDAMRAKDEVRLRTTRSLLTAFTNEVVAKKRKPDELLPDDEALAVLKRAAKQRKDSIEQFTQAGRTDLAEPEQQELAIIEEYLPAQMSEEDIEKVARAKAQELGVSEKKDMGRLMGPLMKELGGTADGTVVKTVLEKILD